MQENNYSSDGKVHDKERLKELQALPLWRKIQITQARIIEWYERNNGKVYISFSGGKDSTVLLDLARRIYPNIQAVFIDTGLEYPELREFVKTFSNVIWLKPKMNFRKVIETYGYPLISKYVAEKIYISRRKPNGLTSTRFDDNSEYNKKYKNIYSLSKWKWLRDSNIPISHMCCNIMKKQPAKIYEKETKNLPILATMACESKARETAWLKNGCNAFNSKRPVSQPISFWTEQDILMYLYEFKIPYASVYGDIKKDDLGKLYTTKCYRTGCVFCGFGCHLEKEPNRFQRLKQTHPQLYEYCMKPKEQGGLGMNEVLNYINVKH